MSRGIRSARGERGVVLAIVLVLIFALITAVYAFQRRAIIDTTIAHNRLAAAEADALARGGIRIAEAIVFLAHAKQAASQAGPAGALPGGASTPGASPDLGAALGAGGAGGADLWERVGDYPLAFSRDRSLRIRIEDEGALLNLNALVPPPEPESANGTSEPPQPSAIGTPEEDDDGESLDDAEQYLTAVLEYIVAGIPGTREDRAYDEEAIARNLIDWMDSDSTARDGRDEDAYYRRQTPPYKARNGPFLTFDEIGLVEGVDGKLLEAMRSSLTVHPIGSTNGINVNRAKPWVLALLYSGAAGDRKLASEKTVRALWAEREKGKKFCDESGAAPGSEVGKGTPPIPTLPAATGKGEDREDAEECVPLKEVDNGALAEGDIFPPVKIPADTSVFRVVAEARVDHLVRRMEAIIDTRPKEGPLLLSWRRLRGSD